jgi:3-oxoacyl-(acyl-carrier-protein) synthase
VIAAYVIIREHSVVLNGNQIFSGSGDVEKFFDAAYEDLQVAYPKFYKMDRISKAGIIAAEVLVRAHSLQAYSGAELALILSNRSSSMDSDKRYLEASARVSSPALFVYTLPNIVAGEICIRHRIKGENAFFVTDEFDAALTCGYADMIFRAGAAKACLAGWVDVIDEHYEVFLYLIEKENAGSPDEEAVRIQTLYDTTYGTIDRQP